MAQDVTQQATSTPPQAAGEGTARSVRRRATTANSSSSTSGGSQNSAAVDPAATPNGGNSAAHRAWYKDKENLALITGFISTGLTIANMLVATILGQW